MKRITVLLLLILCLPISGFGAQIFGNLRANNASVGAGVPVRIDCGAEAPQVQTDAYGSYSVSVPIVKKCELRVYYGNQWSEAFDVFPYEDPVRYDFDLFEQPKGPAILKRR